MFGTNTVVGKKHFADANGRLMVTSIFLTLQGEGPFRGRPAIFVRLTHCNLDCSFCDTYFSSGEYYDLDTLSALIIGKVEAYYDGDAPPVGLVITGGEPMLQSDALTPFLERVITPVEILKSPMGEEFDRVLYRYKFVQIETNGTLSLKGVPWPVTVVVSPKATESRYLMPRDDVLNCANCLKFVISADVLSPYHTIPTWAHKWRQQTGREIFISPMNIYAREPDLVTRLREGREVTIEDRNRAEVVSFWEPGLLDMDKNRRNHEYAAQYCLRHGYTFNVQLHLLASLA